MEQYLEYEGRRLFSWNSAFRVSGQWASIAANVSRVNMPAFNWRDPPRIGVNQLYYPNGATRWTVGLFLATDSAMRQIFAAVNGNTTSGGGAALYIDLPDTSDTLQWNLWMLPPQPISVQTTKANLMKSLTQDPGEVWGNETIWLLPLVDLRYFWQGMSTVPGVASWDTLLGTTIPTTVGGSVTPGFTTCNADQDYVQPDQNEFARSYPNQAPLIDAAAASIGRMPVFDPYSEQLSFPSWEQNKLPWNDQDLMAGGPWSVRSGGAIPQYVAVTFPMCQLGAPVANGQLYQIVVPFSGVQSTLQSGQRMPSGGTAWANASLQVPVPGAMVTIHDSAQANMASGVGGIPTNVSYLQRLATRIAYDYYGRWSMNFTATVNRLIASPGSIIASSSGTQHIPNPCEDYRLIKYGSSYSGQLGFSTRFVSLPLDHGPLNMWHTVPQPASSSSSSSGSSASSSGSAGSAAASGSGSGSASSGVPACWTPAMAGLPGGPATGTWILALTNGCLNWMGTGPCP